MDSLPAMAAAITIAMTTTRRAQPPASMKPPYPILESGGPRAGDPAPHAPRPPRAAEDGASAQVIPAIPMVKRPALRAKPPAIHDRRCADRANPLGAQVDLRN